MSSHLIDATEMYLRTVYELEEEGITPIRARLVERLGLSAPAVSETVARLEAEGLMHVAADRTLELSDLGRTRAVSVMRKHRLAECLLVDVIGLDWEQVHIEACRWEHVISDAVEQRLTDLLGSPTTDPHGNPIPGLVEVVPAPRAHLLTMAEAAKTGVRATVSRISEKLQGDVSAMQFLSDSGLRPGATAAFTIEGGTVCARVDHAAPVEVSEEAAEHVYVTPAA